MNAEDHNIARPSVTSRFDQMTAPDMISRPGLRLAPWLFVATTFFGAGLVFMVEPLVAKLVLPMLGGSPSVWNTSLAVFQTALLVGYGYAHLLQKIGSLRVQAMIHVAVLLIAALFLPLRVTELLGPPSSEHPILWLIGVLTVSIGAPFAALSATAPLVQAWYARTFVDGPEAEPYGLYAASNLGSLLALLAYPVLVEPLSTLHNQTLGWSLGYAGFALFMAGLAISLSRRSAGMAPVVEVEETTSLTVTDRAGWVALAALPSSLMLGVTSYLATDVASAPFLWVIPLALYLVTFILAFARRTYIAPNLALGLQALAVVGCAAVLPFRLNAILLMVVVHLTAFFLSALVCHQALVARRPAPRHLTEFYLWMSLGGVVGGAFNAFIAPVIFENVWEYPLVLCLVCLARPWGHWQLPSRNWALLGMGMALAVVAALASVYAYDGVIGRLNLFGVTGQAFLLVASRIALAVAAIAALAAHRRGLYFTASLVVLSLAAQIAGDRVDTTQSWRSFFGVVRQSKMWVPELGGWTRMMAHGTTLHGAQAQDPRFRCRPLVYYAPETPIGQVFGQVQSTRPQITVGAVGLGTGAVAAYSRKGDQTTFFEIDPLVIQIASDPAHFSYTTLCAKGQVSYVLGDARLTLADQPANAFDILLIDAFSSDSVPAHLLTVEAVRGYLTHLKPDGVLILHLSNRNLDLVGPAMAVAYAAGGEALVQHHEAKPGHPLLWESSEDAVIVARSEQALKAFADDPRWEPTQPVLTRPWTDDYTNLIGALISRTRERMANRD